MNQQQVSLSFGRGPLVAADTSNGLPSNQVHRVVSDQFSRLWLSGPAGIACFDGSTVVAFDRRDGLQCVGTRSVGVTDDGYVWIGTDRGIEALDANGVPASWMAWFPWTFGLSNCIVVNGLDVWVGTAQGVVRIKRGVSSGTPSVAFHAKTGFVRHLTLNQDGSALASCDGIGLVEVSRKSWQPLTSPALYNLRIACICVAQSRNIYVGTDDGALVLDSRYIELLHLRSPDFHRAVTAIAVGASHCWVAYGRTLVSYPLDSDVAAEVYSLNGRVNHLHLDAIGNVWIATDTSGLKFLSCLRHAIQKLDIGSDSAVFSIKPQSDHRFDLGGENLLASMEMRAADDTIDVVRGHREIPSTAVWDTYADSESLWVASQMGLFRAPKHGNLALVHSDDPVLSAPSRVILSRGDEMWIGTLRGLSLIKNGIAREIRCSAKLPFGYVYAMVVDREERLWMCTLGRGLWREQRNAEFEQVVHGALSPLGNTYAVAFRADGTLAVLQDENVIIVDKGNTALVIQVCHPVAGWSCLWMDEHTLAIGSFDGLRLLEVATGRVTLSVSSHLEARDWEFTNNRALAKASPETLLCGVNGGLVRVDLKAIRQIAIAPEVRLADLRWRGAKPLHTDGIYKLGPGAWAFRARVFCAWFVDHVTLRYRFKLVGFDEGWSILQENPECTYNSLPPGRYELHVQAYSPLTGFSAAQRLVQIHVALPWWASGWSSAANAVSVGYDRVVRLRYRNKRLIEHSLELEREVSERTAALRAANEELQRAHLEMEAASLTDPLTEIPNRRQFDMVLVREIARCHRLHAPLSVLVIDVDHFKRINDELGHTIGDVYLKEIARILKESIRQDVDTCARYGGEEFVVLMPSTSSAQAKILGDRVRMNVAAFESTREAVSVRKVTISGGIKTMIPGDVTTEIEFLAQADAAMYEAKHNGRDQIIAR